VSQPWTVRPLQNAHLIPLGLTRSPFEAPWIRTEQLLTRELTWLEAKRSVLELDLTEAALRIDGGVKANARMFSPRARLSFESVHGPLSYATGRYSDWHSNVRAIALSLEALRKVDRYGITRAGEQYTGWRALPATSSVDQVRVAALRVARIAASPAVTDDVVVDKILSDPDAYRAVYRQAARNAHPDHGGDRDRWARLEAARSILDAHHGATR
jgi:hypothetical protein